MTKKMVLLRKTPIYYPTKHIDKVMIFIPNNPNL